MLQQVLRVFAIGVVWLVPCLSPRDAGAYFERVFVSSRAAALGGAFVAIADDPSAAVLNPGGLTQITAAAFLSSFTQPYDIADLREHFIAAALPTRYGTFAASWHRLSLLDVSAEDLISFAYGRDIIRTSQEASLSVGLGLDLTRVSYSRRFDTETAVTGSAGVHLRPFPVIGFGYTLRNIGEPSFDQVAGGATSELATTQAFGVAYYWRRQFIFLYERQRGQDGVWTTHTGAEADAGGTLRFRAGAGGGTISGGIGVTVSGITVNAAAISHEVLGLSYTLSLGVSLRRGPEAARW